MDQGDTVDRGPTNRGKLPTSWSLCTNSKKKISRSLIGRQITPIQKNNKNSFVLENKRKFYLIFFSSLGSAHFWNVQVKVPIVHRRKNVCNQRYRLCTKSIFGTCPVVSPSPIGYMGHLDGQSDRVSIIVTLLPSGCIWYGVKMDRGDTLPYGPTYRGKLPHRWILFFITMHNRYL